jgi:hypothetical protein
LQAALRRGIQRDKTDETLYTEWQSRWSGRREELARRLTAIDSQLDSLEASDPDTPRLALLPETDDTAFSPCDEAGFGPYFEID